MPDADLSGFDNLLDPATSTRHLRRLARGPNRPNQGRPTSSATGDQQSSDLTISAAPLTPNQIIETIVGSTET